MKGLFASLCALFAGVSASASIYNTNYTVSGTEKALQICDSLMFSDDKYNCAMFVRDYHFSSSAVDVCAKAAFASDKIDCLKKIANKSFQPQAVKVCALNAFAFDQTTCLQKIADRRFDPNALPLCAGLSFGSDRIACLERIAEKRFMKSAVDFCTTQFSFESDRTSCINKMAGAYVQDEALRLCKQVTWQSEKMSCVEAVKNRYFSANDLYICERFAANNMTQCLRDKSSSIEVLPQYNRLERRSDMEITLDTLDYLINGGRSDTTVVITPKPHVQEKQCNIRAQGSQTVIRSIAKSKFYTWVRTEGLGKKACAIGRLGDTDGSSMLADSNGTIRIQNATYDQIDAFKKSKRAKDLEGQGCAKYICDAIN